MSCQLPLQSLTSSQLLKQIIENKVNYKYTKYNILAVHEKTAH